MSKPPDQERPCRSETHLFGFLSKPALILGIWFERRQQRRALAEMDDRLLDDLGLRRDQVRSEAAKPFWKGMRLSEFGPHK
jgi:uncharacterized protein YjiS (DUF1127 family)